MLHNTIQVRPNFNKKIALIFVSNVAVTSFRIRESERWNSLLTLKFNCYHAPVKLTKFPKTSLALSAIYNLRRPIRQRPRNIFNKVPPTTPDNIPWRIILAHQLIERHSIAHTSLRVPGTSDAFSVLPNYLCKVSACGRKIRVAIVIETDLVVPAVVDARSSQGEVVDGAG